MRGSTNTGAILVDFFDRLALANRKYETRRSALTGKMELALEEVLRAFHGKTIVEMEVRPHGKEPHSMVHQLGRPVSLIDGIAEISSGQTWYQVRETAPSGDYAKVRITALPAGGQVAMLVGRRMPDHAPSEDALLSELRNRSG
jgi:hypothetical protein